MAAHRAHILLALQTIKLILCAVILTQGKGIDSIQFLKLMLKLRLRIDGLNMMIATTIITEVHFLLHTIDSGRLLLADTTFNLSVKELLLISNFEGNLVFDLILTVGLN